MQARSLSAGPLIAVSIAAGMPLGSEGSTQPASGACAIAGPASAPARIVAENSVRNIFSTSPIANAPKALVGDVPEPACYQVALDAKGRYRIGGGQITRGTPYLDQGGTTPLLRAYAIDCPRCSC
jgi:hypothetical protein